MTDVVSVFGEIKKMTYELNFISIEFYHTIYSLGRNFFTSGYADMTLVIAEV